MGGQCLTNLPGDEKESLLEFCQCHSCSEFPAGKGWFVFAEQEEDSIRQSSSETYAPKDVARNLAMMGANCLSR
jgi:hypothetical protein